MPTWLYLPSLMSFCLLRNQSGILYWRGFCMMVTTLSTCRPRTKRSHVRTPADLQEAIHRLDAPRHYCWCVVDRCSRDAFSKQLHNTHAQQTPPHLLLRQLSRSLGEVDVSLPQDHMGIAPAYTLRTTHKTHYQGYTTTRQTQTLSSKVIYNKYNARYYYCYTRTHNIQ